MDLEGKAMSNFGEDLIRSLTDAVDHAKRQGTATRQSTGLVPNKGKDESHV